MRDQPGLLRAAIGFLLSFPAAVFAFVVLTGVQLWLHGGASAVPEPERIRQFLAIEPIIGAVVAAFCIAPALAVYLITHRLSVILEVTHVSYFMVGGALVGLISFGIAYWLMGLARLGEPSSIDHARALATLADALASGALGGVVYWIVAIRRRPWRA